MAKSVKEPDTSSAPSKKSERKPAKSAKGPRKPELPLQVRYRKTMRLNRTYPLTIEVPRKLPEDNPLPLVVVRAVVPGALVTPAEQRMDLARKGEKVTFYVTPLSRGPLPRARLEVFAPGQPVQELRLSMGTKTQRKTWLLLLLTFLIPFLLWRLVWGSNRYNGTTIKDDIINNLKGKSDPPATLTVEDRHNYEGPLHGINVVSQKWKDAPDWARNMNLHDLDLVDAISDGAMYAYSHLFDWLEKEHGMLWVFLALLVVTMLSWLWHRPWRGGRKLMFPLSGSGADDDGSPATLAPLG